MACPLKFAKDGDLHREITTATLIATANEASAHRTESQLSHS